jgi:hypothetical protein
MPPTEIVSPAENPIKRTEDGSMSKVTGNSGGENSRFSASSAVSPPRLPQ